VQDLGVNDQYKKTYEGPSLIRDNPDTMSQTWVYRPEYVTGANGAWAGAGGLRQVLTGTDVEHTCVECSSGVGDCLNVDGAGSEQCSYV
jgi:hypothetical protein